MATQGAYVVSGSPFRYSSPVLALSHFWSPPPCIFPFPPLPSPSSLHYPTLQSRGLRYLCVSRARLGRVRGGGVRVGSCAIVSPFSICGGGTNLIASFLPSEPNWDVLGGETQHLCWKSKKEGGGGILYEFPRGCSAGTSFLDVSFLFFLLLWARFAGVSCIFSSCVLDMFPSVSTYKVKGTCLLKPKVRGPAVA